MLMSSMSSWAVTCALRTGWPPRWRRSAKALSIAARLGRMPTWMRTPSRVKVRATDAGPDLAVGLAGTRERLRTVVRCS